MLAAGAADPCQNNDCSGTIDTTEGMYKWVPGGAKWDSGVLKINTGYWHMVSPDELGFMDRIRRYVDVGVASVRNWTTRQLTPPPGMTWGIIPPQVLLFLTGG